MIAFAVFVSIFAGIIALLSMVHSLGCGAKVRALTNANKELIAGVQLLKDIVSSEKKLREGINGDMLNALTLAGKSIELMNAKVCEMESKFRKYPTFADVKDIFREQLN